MAKNLQTILKNITQGVYVISVNHKGEKNAFTAAWVMQVSFDPLLICFSINPKHRSYSLLKKGNICCISVLNNQQFNIAVHFGQSIPDKMSAYQWLETKSGAPALAESLAYFDCCVDNFSRAGDHEIVLCKVINAEIIAPGEPMLYKDTDDMDSSSALYKK
jgi:flavin reductase (DIM6/NTAB) family NADH-FMN oxidoreductase RutF